MFRRPIRKLLKRPTINLLILFSFLAPFSFLKHIRYPPQLIDSIQTRVVLQTPLTLKWWLIIPSLHNLALVFGFVHF